MVDCKILWICLVVVAINARVSQSHILKDLKDCACFPTDKGKVRISNLADKHGKHERIVVYIFKHHDTRKVTFYVPSEEKQVKFPDLTVNSLETYTDYTIENLYQIVNNPKIPIMDPSHTHLINVNIPDVPKHHKHHNHVHPHIINIKPHKNGKKPVSTDTIDIEVIEVDGHQKVDINNIQPQHNKQEPIIHVIEPVNTVPGHKEKIYVPMKPVQIANHVVPNNQIITGVDVPDNTHLEIENIPVVDIINKQEIKIPSHINIKHITDKVIQPLVVTKPSKGSITIIDDVMRETDINSITKIEEMLNGNNDNALPSPASLKQVNNPVIHKWLVEEISNVGTATYNTEEIHRIKIRLFLVLEQNGLRFSEIGDLIDMNGRVLKISNLKLRRVMISDPVVYKKLGGKCVPHGIPYLEAVFVSLVHPPTVLGVIPLRMTSLPRCKKGKCKKCAARKNNHMLISSRHPQKLNLIPTHGVKMGLIPRMSSDDKNEDVSPTPLLAGVDKNEDVSPTPLHTDVDKNGAVLPTSLHTGVDKKETILLSPVHSGVDKNENILSTRVRTGIHDGHDRHDDGDDDDDDDKAPHGHDHDDGLGIRIIGGQPAISSGTPVSSRGRSGNIDVLSSVY